MKWTARFHGRRVGALGITYDICITVDADTAEAVRLACYEGYEHISGGLPGIRVTPAPDVTEATIRDLCPYCGHPRNSSTCQRRHP